jgi:hypothetical protein
LSAEDEMMGIEREGRRRKDVEEERKEGSKCGRSCLRM